MGHPTARGDIYSWQGGKRPVAKDVRVVVFYSDGCWANAKAGSLKWKHKKNSPNIVAYCVEEESDFVARSGKAGKGVQQ